MGLAGCGSDGGTGGLDGESRSLMGSLMPGLPGTLDAGGDVNGVGQHDADGVGDVVGCEAAGEDDGRKAVEFAGVAGFGDPVPVEGLAGSAELGGGGVEKDGGCKGVSAKFHGVHLRGKPSKICERRTDAKFAIETCITGQ